MQWPKWLTHRGRVTPTPKEAPGTAQESSPKSVDHIQRAVLAFFAKYILNSSKGKGRKEFTEEAPVDLDEIRRAAVSDSYIRQSFDKYVDIMFKAGWTLDGKNPDAIKYIRQRLQLIADATGKPTEVFLREIGTDLVKYDNVFIVATRGRYKNLPFRININPVGERKDPITAFFFMHPASVRITRDENGNVISYKQVPMGQRILLNGSMKGVKDPYPVFKVEDVIHMYGTRENGFAFGVPSVASALEDVKLLRVMEENVARLVYRMTFPFVHIKIGLPKEGQEAAEEEIDDYKREIENQPPDATLVTGERVTIDVKGVEGEALRVEEYLKYFEARSFTGLAVSPIQLGRGDTSNRSTSDTLSTELHDRIKSFQKIITTFFNEFIIKELLLEGGFNYYLTPDTMVALKFNEIELDFEIKLQNHAIALYEHEAIDEDELRRRLGLEPVTEAQRPKMHLNMVVIPRLKAAAEAAAAAALGRAGGNASPKDVDNLDQPANQHGKAMNPKMEHRESVEPEDLYGTKVTALADRLRARYEDLVNDLKLNIQTGRGSVQLCSNMTKLAMRQAISSTVVEAFTMGVVHFCQEINKHEYNATIVEVWAKELRDYATRYVNKFCDDAAQCALDRNTEGFESIRYRLQSMADHQVKQSFWFGYNKEAVRSGYTAHLVTNETSCTICIARQGAVTGHDLDSVPAHHPGCKCKLKAQKGAPRPL